MTVKELVAIRNRMLTLPCIETVYPAAEEFAKQEGVSIKTVYRWCNQEKLRFRKFRGKTYILGKARDRDGFYLDIEIYIETGALVKRRLRVVTEISHLGIVRDYIFAWLEYPEHREVLNLCRNPSRKTFDAMQLLESGLKQCEVAKKLGLTKQRISQIANKKKAGHSQQGVGV
jgi:hypothetical protein